MIKLLKHMKGYRAAAISAPFFKVLEALFELMIPLVVASIIDVGIKNSDRPYVFKMCGLMILLGLIGFTCTLFAQYFAARAAVGFSANIRSAVFKHAQKLSFAEIDRLGTSTMITRITNDVTQVQSGVNLTLRLFSRSPVIVFGSMIMAFTLDVKSAFIFVVAIPILCIIVFGIMLGSIPLYKKVQANLDRVLGITRENLAGTRVIRAFANEETEIKNFDRTNAALNAAQKFAGKFSALMNPVTCLVVNLAIVALIYTGAIRVETGILTQGIVIALYNYMSQILVELVKLANLIITMTKATACAGRIEQILEEGGKVPIKANSSEKKNNFAVSFSDVSFTYDNASDESLSNINFSVNKGETVGIIGGTGSGKTSLAHLIPRFYDATKGEICLDGIDIRAYSENELREKVGIVMQKAVLFKGTIRENIRWGNPKATDEQIMEALEIAQASDLIKDKEGGLDFVIEQGGKNLSGGQRQRLGIARTLVGEPDILIFDDSASALDYATDACLRSAVRNMQGERTVFIISQRTASILHADRILVLDDGKLVGSGKHEELLASCEVYREIYYSQFPKDKEVALV
ncbi:MAG: ABC transporter ATP-binding protein [Ruminococcaceae bacterium]|nr:ABC transporter ATP-binding protein [Oscillospiraceae bacterium]